METFPVSYTDARMTARFRGAESDYIFFVIAELER